MIERDYTHYRKLGINDRYLLKAYIGDSVYHYYGRHKGELRKRLESDYPDMSKVYRIEMYLERG